MLCPFPCPTAIAVDKASADQPKKVDSWTVDHHFGALIQLCQLECKPVCLSACPPVCVTGWDHTWQQKAVSYLFPVKAVLCVGQRELRKDTGSHTHTHTVKSIGKWRPSHVSSAAVVTIPLRNSAKYHSLTVPPQFSLHILDFGN